MIPMSHFSFGHIMEPAQNCAPVLSEVEGSKDVGFPDIHKRF
ncbi:MAG: hypothetical protein AB1598_06360 [Thermodesulfobacteriota bacterium]